MKLKEASHKNEIDIKLTKHDIEALRQRSAPMTTKDYLCFLKGVNNINILSLPHKGPAGEKFELP